MGALADHPGVVTEDKGRHPSVARITIKQSKTDPFCKGVPLFVGRTHNSLCPVAALLDYLMVRGKAPGSLFRYQDGRFLTQTRFAEAVKTDLHVCKAGIDYMYLKYNIVLESELPPVRRNTSVD